jgi:hypothetical protein
VYDLVESYVGDGGIELPARKRALWAAMFPDIPERFPTLESLGAATLSELLGPARAAMPGLGAVNLDSGVLLNRGERFEWRALPVAAQLAPASGLVVADFDGDGLEDVFVAQNFFGVCRDDARYDAGRGLLLRGDGHGRFAAAADPGIAAWGEQRGAATADFDGDGRPDLVVGQNASPTMLFRNAGARPGLRVRLAGPARDADGIGASLRWIAGGVAGPRREIRAGGGYWSVDSPVTVLGTGRAAGEVEVRWPDGTTRRRAVAAGVAEVTLRHDGKETP